MLILAAITGNRRLLLISELCSQYPDAFDFDLLG